MLAAEPARADDSIEFCGKPTGELNQNTAVGAMLVEFLRPSGS